MAVKKLLEQYLECIGPNECPVPYHRWTLLTIASALLARRAYIPFGADRIYPNLYTVFIGQPGSRRSTAIRIGMKFLRMTDFDSLSVDQTSKEQLWRDMSKLTPAYLFIAQDEISDFIGRDATRFVDNLGRIYDNPPKYDVSTRGGGYVNLDQPTLVILAATNHTKLQRTFSPEAIEGGFLSRCILISAKEVSTKVAWPPPLNPSLAAQVEAQLKYLMEEKIGELVFKNAARDVVEEIYHNQPSMPDRRFTYYSSRRHITLLKIVILLACLDQTLFIDYPTVIEANTLLHTAELRMPLALGEFGRSKTVAQNQLLLSLIQNADRPLSLSAIHRMVSTDFENIDELINQLTVLEQVNKIQRIQAGSGSFLFSSYEDVSSAWPPHLIDYSYLTNEENPDVL